MKKILNFVLLVPTYILIFILNNCKILFFNYQNNISFFQNVDFINLPIIISLIAFLLLIFLNKGKVLKNKVIASSFFVVLSLSVLNGIFSNKGLDNYIILYFYFIVLSISISIKTKQSFNISLFVFTIISIFIMTIMAIFNILYIYKYIVILSAITALIYLLNFKFKNNDTNTIITDKSKYGIIIFSIMFIVLIMGGINRYVHIYDEYSHWAFDAKAVIEYDKLSTCEEVMSPTRNYPPAISLWHYFIDIFINNGSESNLYIGLSILILIALLPCFEFVRKKNLIFAPLFVIAVYFLCYLFGNTYSYTSLYADYALSAFFAVSFVFDIMFKDKPKILLKYLFLSLGICCLIKPTGILLAGSFILIKVLQEFLALNEDKKFFYNFKKNIKIVVKKWWKISFALISIFVCWNIYVKICNNVIYNYYDFRLLPDTLATDVSSKLNLYSIGKVSYNLLKSFSDNILTGLLKINLFQFILIMILGIMIMCFLENKKTYKIKQTIPFFCGYLMFFILTFFSIFVMFTKYEAENLASFGRYLNAFHYAILLVLLVVIYKNINVFEKKNKKCILLSSALIVIVINISFVNITYFVSDYYTERKATHDISYERQEKFKIVNNNTPVESEIYVLDQKDTDGIMAMWYSRYYMFPRRTNASSTIIGWKIKTVNNKEDLRDWGLSASDLQTQLYKYSFDYLYLYTYDEEMFKQIKFMLNEPYENIMDKYTLFKVKKNNDNTVTLLPVA